jgi:putative Holliday junction resolvase
MRPVGRILGIDVGERHIGIAVSTPEGHLAVPLRVMESQGQEADVRAIAAVAQAEDVVALVVGYPRSLSGKAGAQARRVASFANSLRQASALPVELWDERLSSRQAQRAAPGGRNKKAKVRSDDIAAAIVLQAYLDRMRNMDT